MDTGTQQFQSNSILLNFLRHSDLMGGKQDKFGLVCLFYCWRNPNLPIRIPNGAITRQPFPYCSLPSLKPIPCPILSSNHDTGSQLNHAAKKPYTRSHPVSQFNKHGSSNVGQRQRSEPMSLTGAVPRSLVVEVGDVYGFSVFACALLESSYGHPSGLPSNSMGQKTVSASCFCRSPVL